MLCLCALEFARSRCLWEALELRRVADDDRLSLLLLLDVVGDAVDAVILTDVSVAGLKDTELVQGKFLTFNYW